MAPRTGLFTWRENLTTDVARTKAFYSEVVGWTWKDMPMGPGMTYYLAHAGEKQVGGLMAKPAEMAMPSCWMAYVSVENADATVASTMAHGGRVYQPAHDIPQVGRFAVLASPDGAAFAILQPTEGSPMTHDRPKAGEFCWESLGTNDIPGAKKFYSTVFGWNVDETLSLFKRGEDMMADINPAPPGVPPNWMSHIAVEKLADANARVLRNGGKVLMAEIKVPTFGAFSVVSDPAGAVVALFEPAQG